MVRPLTTTLALLLALLPIAASAQDVSPSQRVRRAVVIRAAPSTAAPAVGRLPPGESVELAERLPGWYRVRLRDSDANENTLVVRLDASGRRVLLAGDAEAGERAPPGSAPGARSIEAGLISCCAAGLGSDALVVGHHGSLTSSRRAFLDAVGAKVFVVSSGPHPYSGVTLPDAAVVAELATRGQLLRTDDDDEACELRERKVGPDVDESPGGCSSVLLRLTPTAIAAGWSPVVD